MGHSVIIAPDSFKGSVPAREVAAAIARGWASVRPDDRVTLIPQADGGEGTLDAIATAVPDAVLHCVGSVTGPDGRPTAGMWLELPGRVGVVELAQSCGLPLMKGPDPLGATTRGLGEVIRHALGHGVDSLVIGLGGSASTDGGAGALAALGLQLLDEHGAVIPDGGGSLASLASIRRDAMIAPPPRGATLLTDVSAPLLGPTGAAAVFGPQKGAAPADIRTLDAALARFASLLGGNPDQPGAGAAGGVAYGLAAVWGATIEPGAAYLQKLSGLTAAIVTADVVITGEGRFDDTSSGGKVVGELLRLAGQHQVAVGIIAGQVATEAEAWTLALAELAGTAQKAIADPVPVLEEAGRRAARHFTERP